MKKIILDGKKCLNKELTYEYIKKKLVLPKYCANNLDALWDCLNEINELEIFIKNKNYLIKNLNEYGYDLLKTFKDYANQNNKFILRIKN